jgi:hypothetical protein
MNSDTMKRPFLRLFSLSLAFLCGGSLLSQPANDAICSATALTVGLSCTQGTNASATSAGTPGTPSCWLSAPSNDVWYSFVATATDMTISTDVTGLGLTDTEIAIYSTSNGTCTGTLTQVGCDEDGGVNQSLNSIASLTSLTVGNTYYVRVDGFSTSTGTFCISVAESMVPGSSPCDAQSIFPNSGACSVANGNLNYNSTTPTGSYAPLGVDYCGCDNETSQYGTWSTFTATSTGTYTITNQTAGANNTPVDYTLFSGSCSSPSCISCTSVAKGGSTTWSITSGTTYYVLTTLQSSSTSTPFRTDFCLQSPAACTVPTNDNCASAISITSGTQYSTTTLCATPDDALCSGSMENNIWYSWTCPVGWTGQAYFQMFNQNCTAGDVSNGSQVSIFNAGQTCATTSTCAAYSNLGSDNNVNIFWTPSVGSTYLITFDGNAGEVCNLTFQITNSPPLILSVDLLEFIGEKSDEDVQLKWATASERSNDYFTIERSADGKIFEPIAVVDGAGNSQSTLSYSLLDANPVEGINYYRLKQTDFNLNSSYSRVVEIEFERNGGVFAVMPNPTAGQFDVRVKCKGNSREASLRVYDANGALVNQKEVNCSSGENILKFDLGGRANGMYFVVLTIDGKVYKNKLIKD